jgi:oligopeptide/dipeptide ABC transporter ATP-binding protein
MSATAATDESDTPATDQTKSVTNVLEVSDLNVRFGLGDETIWAVNGVSFSVHSGKTLAIIGESGSGKTVTSRAILGLLPNTAHVTGSARLEGSELIGMSEKEMRRRRGPDIATVFQDPSRSLNPTMRVGAQIVESIRLHLPMDRHAAKKRAIELLGLVRLPSPERRCDDYPHQLSGGMRQRVMIALALACQPKVLIADEATTALDVTTQAKIMELLLDLQEQFKMAMIMISHNLGLAAQFSDEVLVMYGGRVAEYAPTKTLFAHVQMPYTRVLLDAVPRLGRAAHTALPIVAGGAPSLHQLPIGCAFSNRCPRAADKCRTETPPLREDEPGHVYACWFPIADAIPVQASR